MQDGLAVISGLSNFQIQTLEQLSVYELLISNYLEMLFPANFWKDNKLDKLAALKSKEDMLNYLKETTGNKHVTKETINKRLGSYINQVSELKNYVLAKIKYSQSTAYFWLYLQTYFEGHNSKRLIITSKSLANTALLEDKMRLVSNFLSLNEGQITTLEFYDVEFDEKALAALGYILKKYSFIKQLTLHNAKLNVQKLIDWSNMPQCELSSVEVIDLSGNQLNQYTSLIKNTFKNFCPNLTILHTDDEKLSLTAIQSSAIRNNDEAQPKFRLPIRLPIGSILLSNLLDIAYKAKTGLEKAYHLEMLQAEKRDPIFARRRQTVKEELALKAFAREYRENVRKKLNSIEIEQQDRETQKVNFVTEATKQHQVSLENLQDHSFESKPEIKKTKKKVKANGQSSTGKMTLKESLQLQAVRYGFDCHDVPGDGNCFYHAILHQLLHHNVDGAAKHTHASLRKLACEHIKANLALYRDLVVSNEELAEEAALGKWVNLEYIHKALSRALNVNIILVKSNGLPPGIYRMQQPLATIYIGWEVGMHYQSLVVNPTIKAQEIINIDSVEADSYTPAVQHQKATPVVNERRQTPSQAELVGKHGLLRGNKKDNKEKPIRMHNEKTI